MEKNNLRIISIWNWRRWWQVSILRLLRLQPAGTLTAALFSRCDVHDYIFSPSKFSFWNSMLQKKHIFLLWHLSDTRCSLPGVAKRILTALQSVRERWECQQLCHEIRLVNTLLRSDSSSLLEGKSVTSSSVWSIIESEKSRTYLLCSSYVMKLMKVLKNKEEKKMLLNFQPCHDGFQSVIICHCLVHIKDNACMKTETSSLWLNTMTRKYTWRLDKGYCR